MSASTFLWAPAPIRSLPIRGRTERLPVDRLFFVGRNYHAHAIEMARPVDKAVERPFYFTKSTSTLVQSGEVVPYPAATQNYHFEMELVVAIGAEGFQVPIDEAHHLVYGYACGLDMTRRDLQLAARDKGRPWDLGKDIEHGTVVSTVVPMPGKVLAEGEIVLTVNGQLRQRANLDQLIWDVREIIVDLSTFYRLRPGDLIFTGTPAGVGPVVPGDRLDGCVDGIGEIALRIAAAS